MNLILWIYVLCSLPFVLPYVLNRYMFGQLIHHYRRFGMRRGWIRPDIIVAGASNGKLLQLLGQPFRCHNICESAQVLAQIVHASVNILRKLPHTPSYLVVMPDAGDAMDEYNTQYEDMRRLEKLFANARIRNVRVIMVQTLYLGPKFPNVNKRITAMNAARMLACKNNREIVTLIDFNPEFAGEGFLSEKHCAPDGVHISRHATGLITRDINTTIRYLDRSR